MDAKERSFFQMNNFSVREFTVKEPAKLSQSADLGLQYKALIVYDDNTGLKEWVALLTMSFQLTQTQGGDDGFFMTITAQGAFSCPADALTEDQFVRALKINGAATMIPIMRGQMAAASASLGVPLRATIPNINVPNLDHWEVRKVEAKP